jgi:hypothetical protein
VVRRQIHVLLDLNLQGSRIPVGRIPSLFELGNARYARVDVGDLCAVPRCYPARYIGSSANLGGCVVVRDGVPVGRFRGGNSLGQLAEDLLQVGDPLARVRCDGPDLVSGAGLCGQARFQYRDLLLGRLNLDPDACDFV